MIGYSPKNAKKTVSRTVDFGRNLALVGHSESNIGGGRWASSPLIGEYRLGAAY